MPTDGLEYPGSPDPLDEERLYLAREDDVQSTRPILTGDVFENVEYFDLGERKKKTVMLVQHPCSLRQDGVNLKDRLLVSPVRRYPQLDAEKWRGNFSLFPLPHLYPSVTTSRRHQAALLSEPIVVSPAQIQAGHRIASLSDYGIDLLLQRRVMNDSRVIVSSSRFQEVIRGPFEEADLLEEWAIELGAVDKSPQEAAALAMEWLRAPLEGGGNRQDQLQDSRLVSAVRRASRARIKELTALGRTD